MKLKVSCSNFSLFLSVVILDFNGEPETLIFYRGKLSVFGAKVFMF